VKYNIIRKGLCAVLSCIVFSCGHGKGNEDLFSEGSFNTRIDLRDGRQLVVDDLFLGQPASITFHPDSFLIVDKTDSPMLISIIDLKNNKTQELIPRGRGPGEMLVSRGVTIVDRDIYLYCVQLSKVIILTPAGDRSFCITNEFFIDEKQSGCLHPLSRDRTVCLSAVGDENRFTLLNGNGRILEKFGGYPQFLNDDEIKANNDIFQSVIASTPDGERFVTVCSKTDLFELYDVDAGLQSRFQGPLGLKHFVEATSMGSGYMLRPEPHYKTYRPLIANKDEFWAGFIGHRIERGKGLTLADQCTKKIFCFDWEGKPLRMFSLEFPAVYFDVDWNEKSLYALELHENDLVITTYDLDNYLPDSK